MLGDLIETLPHPLRFRARHACAAADEVARGGTSGERGIAHLVALSVCIRRFFTEGHVEGRFGAVLGVFGLVTGLKVGVATLLTPEADIGPILLARFDEALEDAGLADYARRDGDPETIIRAAVEDVRAGRFQGALVHPAGNG